MGTSEAPKFVEIPTSKEEHDQTLPKSGEGFRESHSGRSHGNQDQSATLIYSTYPDKKGQARDVPMKKTRITYQTRNRVDQKSHTGYGNDHQPPRSCKIEKGICWTAEADRLASTDLAESIELVISLWLPAIYVVWLT